MDKYAIYQNKLTKYKFRNGKTPTPTYHDKIVLYETLCNNLRHELLHELKFHYCVLNFLGMDVIKYISELNKSGDHTKVFSGIKTQLNTNLDVKYNEIDKRFTPDNFPLPQLSNKASWPNLLSKIILWKLLYLYDFNAQLMPKIKEFCQDRITTLLQIYN